MNWNNQDKDPWGGKNDAPDFDDLIKKFSAVLGGVIRLFLIRKIFSPLPSEIKPSLSISNASSAPALIAS
ncbi:protease modulator HflK N-terminal domain-containing protein [Gammaproteobacteria bacterium]|nr:protease modulator HflK N-terminal domain-containing protein [Gammaproteobacteria bacterium]